MSGTVIIIGQVPDCRQSLNWENFFGPELTFKGIRLSLGLLEDGITGDELGKRLVLALRGISVQPEDVTAIISTKSWSSYAAGCGLDRVVERYLPNLRLFFAARESKEGIQLDDILSKR